MIRVYIAGKYSDDSVLSVLGNIRKGMKAAKELLLRGFAPYCPWLDHQLVFQMTNEEADSLTVDLFYDYSIAWLEASDCMYLLREGIINSKGVAKEIEFAVAHHIPIFTSMEDLDAWASNADIRASGVIRKTEAALGLAAQ